IFGRNHWNSCTIVSCGIGQGEVLETPLQIANAMCLIGNHGYYYTPHLVQSIDGDTALLHPFRMKHETTHLSETDFEIVVNAMAQVVEQGTAKGAKIPGIEMCGKTGTAENYAVINGKRTKLKDHSIFAAFAPKDHPRIAICVVVENSGYGATYAAPIASLIVEKYLKDSIATGPRTTMMQNMMNANLIPGYITDLERQMTRREDSIKIARQALNKGKK
ncbi:MAG TPA: penicillin-binding transpeptidase domain-containing protein, partial [Chitinophagaceae bacterium]